MFKLLVLASAVFGCVVCINYNAVPSYNAPALVVGSPVTYNFPTYGGYPAQAPVVLANYGPSVYPALSFATADQDPIYALPQPYSANYKVLEPDTQASVTKVKVDRGSPAVSYEAGLGSITV
ncbi:hypothetical protein ACFFRR_010976 [Megaselia abdita]